ncbi:Camk1 [Symbiodinium sp. CCMP2456]|nr:Camk1 [Symbiodinium sp. CCMP2456]
MKWVYPQAIVRSVHIVVLALEKLQMLADHRRSATARPDLPVRALELEDIPAARAEDEGFWMMLEAALEWPWFGQCEGIQKAHRSQAKHTLGSLTAPKSAQFFEKLRQTASMTCLRRLFHSVRAVRGASVGKEGLQIPGPEEDNKETSTNARAAADAMCAEAFEWLLFTSGATSSGGLPLRKLNTMIQSITQTERSGNVQRHEIEMLKVDTLISSVQFAEMIWATCA